MLPCNHPDGIRIAFDDHRRVANAGLTLPVTLARYQGLPQLVQQRLDLGNAPGQANPGDKMMTLAATALTTPTCCAPAGRLARSAARSRRHPPWGPSCAASGGATSVNWIGVSRELLARAWSAGAGPGDAPFTIDLDSTICERPMVWSRKASATTATPASGAITRYWPWPLALATC